MQLLMFYQSIFYEILSMSFYSWCEKCSAKAGSSRADESWTLGH